MKHVCYFIWGITNAIIVLVFFISCEEQTPTNAYFNPTISKDTIIGINTTEIGGRGLVLISSRDNNSPIDNNTFNTVVSKEGLQLLVVVDENNKVRALTLSLPNNASDKKSSIIQINTLSTAIASIFISPGILTLYEKEATQVIDNIESLDSFNPFKIYLEQNLLSISLSDIALTDQYIALLTNCLNEYYQKFSIVVSGVFEFNKKWENDLYIDQISDNNIEIHNRALRCVSIVERDIDETGDELNTSHKIYSMPGAPPFSWGSVITLSYLRTHNTEILNYIPFTNIVESEFWAIGPSFKLPVVSVPESIYEVDRGWEETICEYVVWPLLDLFWGVEIIHNIPTQDIKALVSTIKVLRNSGNLMATDNDQAALSALMNLFQSVCSTILTLGPEQIPKTISEQLAINNLGSLSQAAGQLFLWGNVILSAGNLIGVKTNLMMVEPFTKFQIKTKDNVFNPDLAYGTAIDIDLNIYKTIKIGENTWMAENLRSTKLNDGTHIELITNDNEWSNIDNSAYCWYQNDQGSYRNTYGALYNWYTIATKKLCPKGWHVPTEAEWVTLTIDVGEWVAGDKLKETGTQHWLTTTLSVTNEYGFTALPGGMRNYENGNFKDLREIGYFWTSTEDAAINALVRPLSYDHPDSYTLSALKKNGFSVRCIKDND